MSRNSVTDSGITDDPWPRKVHGGHQVVEGDDQAKVDEVEAVLRSCPEPHNVLQGAGMIKFDLKETSSPC